MRTMVMLAEAAQAPCPSCGSTDVQRSATPSTTGDGKEHVTSTCSGCGESRGSEIKEMHGRVRNHPLVYPKGELTASASIEDDIQKVKQAINRCDAYGSVSMWLLSDGGIQVVEWHGGQSMTERGFSQGKVRLHWDPSTFIVHWEGHMTAMQSMVLNTLLEAIRMPSVTVMHDGIHVDQSGNPLAQMRTVKSGTKKDYTIFGVNGGYETRCTHPGCRHHYKSPDKAEAIERIENHARTHKMALLKQATPSPSQIKAACWSKGFFELMADVFGSHGNDPVHGACRLVMEALKIIFPSGEKMATINDRGDSDQIKEFYRTHQPMVQHYVLKVGGQYLDGNGAHTAHEVCTDEDLGGWREIPNLLIPVTPALIEGNRGIACPPGAAQKAAQYILDYKG